MEVALWLVVVVTNMHFTHENFTAFSRSWRFSYSTTVHFFVECKDYNYIKTFEGKFEDLKDIGMISTLSCLVEES